jgi:hypothetical protein
VLHGLEQQAAAIDKSFDYLLDRLRVNVPGRSLSHGIGIDFHEARFSLRSFPTAGLRGFANELAGGACR